MNNDCVYIGNIQTRLDNCSAYKHINLAIHKVHHQALKLILIHLTVSIGYIGFRHKLGNIGRNISYIVDSVIDIIYLSVPGYLPYNGFPYHLFVVFAHEGLYGQSFSRRFLKQAHIPDSR